MPEFARPRVVVSRCLGFAPCRWNGEIINDDFTRRLGHWVEFVPVCPEQEIGLGAPRPPVRLVAGPEGPRLVQPATGRDVTLAMREFAAAWLAGQTGVDGFLLKSRSPSCGPLDVKVYASAEPGAASHKGQGLFAAAASESQPGAPVEHEGRVRNFAIREHFLTKLFARAGLRQIADQPSLAGLTGFHARHKLLLMAYSETGLRRMGRLLANPQKLPPAQVAAEYGRLLDEALARPPRVGGVINALMHALGYFKRGLKPTEKAWFLDQLQAYRSGRTPLVAVQGVLMAWIVRFGEDYLASQVLFAPYPAELMDLGDSGKGRDL